MSGRKRRTVARHGQLSSPGAFRQLLALLGVALAVLVVSGAGIGAAVAATLVTDVADDAVELEGTETLPPDIAAIEGGFNVLLTGLDTCEPEYAHLFKERCSPDKTRGTLNDVNLLVHVSDEPRRVTAVSFPRDLMLAIPQCERPDGGTYYGTSRGQLNTAYSTGGLNCVAKTITELTGQDIQFAASVTFGGVIEITNAIGGVEVCLAEGIHDPKHTGLDLAAGDHTLKGFEALQFLRTRHGLVGGSDLARIGNQQVYMNALVHKLRSDETLGDVPTLLRLASTAVRNIEPSTSLTDPLKLVQIALAVKDVPFDDIVFVQYPVADDRVEPGRVVPIAQAGDALFEAIAANQPLQITHQNGKYDGNVVEDDPDASPTPAPTGSPSPAPTAVELPSSVKGSSAAQKVCSHGNR